MSAQAYNDQLYENQGLASNSGTRLKAKVFNSVKSGDHLLRVTRAHLQSEEGILIDFSSTWR